MYRTREELEELKFEMAQKPDLRSNDTYKESIDVWLRYDMDHDLPAEIVVFAKKGQYTFKREDYDTYENLLNLYERMTSGYKEIPAKAKQFLYEEMGSFKMHIDWHNKRMKMLAGE